MGCAAADTCARATRFRNLHSDHGREQTTAPEPHLIATAVISQVQPLQPAQLETGRAVPQPDRPAETKQIQISKQGLIKKKKFKQHITSCSATSGGGWDGGFGTPHVCGELVAAAMRRSNNGRILTSSRKSFLNFSRCFSNKIARSSVTALSESCDQALAQNSHEP
jgi:hypothetical protein